MSVRIKVLANYIIAQQLLTHDFSCSFLFGMRHTPRAFQYSYYFSLQT